MPRRSTPPDLDACGLLVLAGRDEGHTFFMFAQSSGEAQWHGAASRLRTSGYAVIDGFLGTLDALNLRAEARALYQTQPSAFTHGAVGGGRDGEGEHKQHPSIRGDFMVLLASDDERLPAIAKLTHRLDALREALARIGGGDLARLRDVDHRSKPMFAVYPGGGARYMRHVDNPDGNGRLLTVLYYLNARWVGVDGGELRLWTRPSDPVTIAPLLDRVVMFWSDDRVPHEVLASHSERLAISVWYHTPAAQPESNGTAAMRAVAAAAAATQDDEKAWRRARVLAEGDAASREAQQRREDAYALALRKASATLRTQAHVSIQSADLTLIEELQCLRMTALGGAPSGAIVWLGAPLVEGKMKILLHQLVPMSDLAAGCSRLFLARSSGSDVRWLSKPKGAKALVLSRLGTAPTDEAVDGAPLVGGGVIAGGDADADDDADDGSVSAHSRIRALRADGPPPPGWPRASGPFVLMTQGAGTLHVLDCATFPLHLRMGEVDVAGLWSFGGGHDAALLARQAEEGMRALEDSA